MARARRPFRPVAVGSCLFALCLAPAACASAGSGAGGGNGSGTDPAAPDVAFMRGMIHHHAQAVAMARMAPDRAASPAVRRLTARILNSQKTEIDLMADWLRDRGQPAPEIAARALEAAGSGSDGRPGDAGETGGGPGGAIAPPGGWDAGPRMPGVLSDAKMARLEAARGEEFDRLFLTFMIEHHDGAVTMVKNLVDSPDGAREESVFRLASGIRSDQSAEIDRMREMLRELLFGAGRPS